MKPGLSKVVKEIFASKDRLNVQRKHLIE